MVATRLGPPRAPDPVRDAQKPEGKGSLDELALRSVVGYIVGLAALLGAVGLAVYSFCSIHSQITAFTDASHPSPIEVLYVSAGGHVAITVSLVWLIYQVLRASERMVLPRGLATDADLARTYLGISTPQSEVLRLAKQVASLADVLKDK